MNRKQLNIDRYPAVAGQFYEANPEILEKELTRLFAEAKPNQNEHVRAIISPHAGYIFAGKVAASAFNQINGELKYKHIIILASSHQEHFDGASVYCDGDFIMPYGKVIVDTGFCQMLIEQHPDIFFSNPRPHQKEHSIEVQLPFLHKVLKNDYSIVPIIIGSSDRLACKKIATALTPWFTNDNLFIISSDFSHYPSDVDARVVDYKTKDAIVSNNPDSLLNTLKDNLISGVPQLLTSLCGWTSVLTLMYITVGDSSLEYKEIDYSNSSDARLYGEKNRVVGYWAIDVTEKKKNKSDFNLTDTDKTELLKLARKTLQEVVSSGKTSTQASVDYPDSLKANCGAFVSLHKNKQLRGCIGRLIGNIPLYKMIREMTISSALHDYRFLPVTPDELEEIDIELSVLSPLKKITDIKDIELGKHGILIEKGRHSGVFLPQVATETKWTLEEFLGHCARDKADLGWDGWKNADIYIFTATVFGEK